MKKLLYKLYNFQLYKLFIFLIILISITIPAVAVATENLQNAFLVTDDKTTDPLDTAANKAGYNIFGVSPKITPSQAVSTLVGKIISIALSLLGIVFVLLMIYGGYLWMTAQGAEEQVKKAKNIITEAIIGLIIVIGSYAITYFLFTKL